MKLLVTGYGPFLDHKINPSYEVAKKMRELNKEIEIKELPVQFSKLDDALTFINEESFDSILLLGLAGRRSKVTPEKIALNWLYCPGRPDNEGLTFEEGESIEDQEENALFSTFPVEELTQFLNDHELESELSFSAGTYVCNATYFKVLSQLKMSNTKVCFIHMPASVDIHKLATLLVEFSKKLYS